MTTGRGVRKKGTIVWCVAITSDMTVISGDSRGKTSFWKRKNGTLMDSVQSHKAEVLTLTVSGNETTAYTFSSGVDHTLMHFQVGHLNTCNLLQIVFIFSGYCERRWKTKVG